MGHHARRLSNIYGTQRKLINNISKTELLIIDDCGLQRLNEPPRLDQMEIIEDRHGPKSTVVDSQLPVSTPHEIIAVPTLSDAILHRITGGAHRIELKGESLKKQNNFTNRPAHLTTNL